MPLALLAVNMTQGEESMGRDDEHLLIIGNGMAGHRLLEALLKRDQRPRRISVIGGKPTPAYNRILLSHWLAGEAKREALTLRGADWYAEHGVQLVLGEKVIDIDRARQHATTDSGRVIDYDRLVLATGSHPAMPDVPGIKLAGILVFRDLDDAEALTQASQTRRRAVVIGGGLLGLEAAEGLRKRGMQVTLLQRGKTLMNRQLDATAAGLLLCDNRIIGAVLYGDTACGPWYFEQSLAGRDLDVCRQALLFGAGDATPLLMEEAA